MAALLRDVALAARIQLTKERMTRASELIDRAWSDAIEKAKTVASAGGDCCESRTAFPADLDNVEKMILRRLTSSIKAEGFDCTITVEEDRISTRFNSESRLSRQIVTRLCWEPA